MELYRDFSVFITEHAVGMKFECLEPRRDTPEEVWDIMPRIKRWQVIMIQAVHEDSITVTYPSPDNPEQTIIRPIMGKPVPGYGVEITGIRRASDVENLGRPGQHLIPQIARFEQSII